MTFVEFGIKLKRGTVVLLILILAVIAGAAIGKFSMPVFWVLLAVLLAAISLILSVLYERFAFYLLIAMLPLAEMLRVDFIPSTLLILPGGLAVISLLVSVVLRHKRIFIDSPILLLAILLGIWASIATLIVGSVSESRPYWLVIVLLFLVPNMLTQKEHFLRACWLFLLPLGIMGVYVFADRLWFYITSQEISMEVLHMVRFATGDKNIVGMWLTLGLPFVYYLFGYYKNEPGKRFWLLLAGGAMFAGALATLSISVVVGLSVMIAMIVWLQPGMMARLRMLVLGVVIVLLIFSGPISERLQNQQLTNFSESWGTYRGEIWQAGFRTILDYPIFGIGLEPARRLAMMNYIDTWFIQQWYARGILVVPHNIFLSVGMEIGLPGLALYLALLSAVFFLLWNLQRRLGYRETSLLHVFVNILLVALATSWVQGVSLSIHLDKFMWLLMGASIVLANIARNKE